MNNTITPTRVGMYLRVSQRVWSSALRIRGFTDRDEMILESHGRCWVMTGRPPIGEWPAEYVSEEDFEEE